MRFYPIGEITEYHKVSIESKLRTLPVTYEYDIQDGIVGLMVEGEEDIEYILRENLDWILLLDKESIAIDSDGITIKPSPNWVSDMWELMLSKYLEDPYMVTVSIEDAVKVGNEVIVRPIDTQYDESNMMSIQELIDRGHAGCELMIDNSFFMVRNKGLYCNLLNVPSIHYVTSVLSKILVSILRDLYNMGYVKVPNGYRNDVWKLSVIQLGDYSYCYREWMSPLFARNPYTTGQLIDAGNVSIPFYTDVDLSPWNYITVGNIKVVYNIRSKDELSELELV